MENESDNSKEKPKISVIIPALNEEKSIGMVIEKVKDALKDSKFDVVVVDGRSTDKTVEIALQKNAKVIYQKKLGYGNALFAGYMYSIEELNSDILVTIDADDTYEPNDILKLIEPIITNSADYIVGRRKVSSKSMTTSHRFGNKVISHLIRKLLHVNLNDTQCGLFAFRSELIQNIDFFTTFGWAINTELLTRAAESGMNIEQVDVSYHSRISETKVNTIKAGAINLAIILRMMRDSEPLMLLGIIGVIFMSIGVIFGSFVLVDFFETGIVNRPNLAVLSAMLIITGLQIFLFGLVADMVKRRQQKRLRFTHNFYSKK